MQGEGDTTGTATAITTQTAMTAAASPVVDAGAERDSQPPPPCEIVWAGPGYAVKQARASVSFGISPPSLLSNV